MNSNLEQRTQISEQAKIKYLRKVMPQLIADAIVGVQPMDASMAKIFGPQGGFKVAKWEAWHKTLVIWPKQSIYGKRVFGIINKSSRDEFEVPFGVYLDQHLSPGREHRYATNKELFKAKLEGIA